MNSEIKKQLINQQSYAKNDKRQRGIVLFIAMVALVVMSLAAVALIRSVDTGTIVAGNLTAKQSATISADNGLETALAWMASPAVQADTTVLEADNATDGYYATQAVDPVGLDWDDDDSRLAEGTGIVVGTDASGNTVRYVVQRMCRNAGVAAPGNCLFGAPSVGSSSQGVRPSPMAGGEPSIEESPLYRVTARVTSAKNTVSFIQAFVY